MKPNIVTKLLELEANLHSEPKEIDFDFFELDPFSQKLVETAHQNGYIIHSVSGEAPSVVLLGFSHNDKKINQEDRLIHILRPNLSNKDLLMCEGRGPIEILYEHYHNNNLFGKLKPLLVEKCIRTIFNDKDKYVAEFMIASNALKLAEENYCREDPLYHQAVQDYMDTFQMRDENFCYHKATGIIPLINGTTRNYKKLEEQAKIFQLLGVLHIHSGNITDSLENERINYISLIPKERICKR